MSRLFQSPAVRLDLRESPPTELAFDFGNDWQGIPPFGTATSFDEANNQWVIIATQYGGGVWRTVVAQ